MSAELNTSLKPEPFIPEQRATLPIMSDLATEYSALIGQRVTAYFVARSSTTGELLGLIKGPQGELILKIKSHEGVSYAAQNKLLELTHHLPEQD